MLKVLFLDIDGVCNSEQYFYRQFVTTGKPTILGIDPEMAFRAGKIILDTDCSLVISSTWRHSEDGMAEIRQHIYPEIYGQTPRSRSGFRGDEINMWLVDHPEVDRYAILDDDGDFHPGQPLFQTSWKTGLTDEIAKQVTEYLNREADGQD